MHRLQDNATTAQLGLITCTSSPGAGGRGVKYCDEYVGLSVRSHN